MATACPRLAAPGRSRLPHRHAAARVAVGAPGPAPGLDPSWRLILNTFGDLQFGRDIVFTYGPWGFLDTPTITSRATYAVALLARAGVLAALWVVSVRSLTQRWPLLVAAPVASALVVLLSAMELSTLALAATAQYVLRLALTLDRPPQARADLIRLAGLGALAGLMIQVKFSNGIAVGVLVALAVMITPGLRDRRRHATAWACAGAGFVVVLCAAWLARGQSLADLPAWVRGSLELTSGYPDAMSFEVLDASSLPYVMAVLLGLLAVAAAVPRLLKLLPLQRIGTLLVLATMGGFAFKAGFTRHDVVHEGVYFVVVASLFVAIVGTTRVGSWLAVVGVVAATSMALTSLPKALDPAAAAERWQNDASVLISRADHAERIAGARSLMSVAYQVPESLLGKVKGKPVAIDPYEAAVAWAYDLTWQPVPVFQLYAAYTPALDRLNAAALREAPARQRVLRHAAVPIDGRNSAWDSPLYQVALACHYRATATEGSWTLLAKGQDRCGKPESLDEARVWAQSAVEVPRASGDHILLARFTPDPPSLPTRLGRALLKPWTPMYVAADGVTFRVPRETSPSGLMVTVPVIEAGAHPPVDIQTLAFSEPGTLEFVSIPITG